MATTPQDDERDEGPVCSDTPCGDWPVGGEREQAPAPEPTFGDVLPFGTFVFGEESEA